MILHLADDSIFLDYAINQFEEVAPGYSTYLVNSKAPKKIRNVERIIAAESSSKQYKDIIKNLNQFDAVILHALTNDKIKIVNSSDDGIKFIWMFWGADGYYIHKIRSRLLSEATKSLLNTIDKKSVLRVRIKNLISSYDFFSIPYSLLRTGNLPADLLRRKAIRRIDFCAPVIEDDYYLLKEELNLKCKLLPFSYGSIESLKLHIDTKTSKKANETLPLRILLGNSADPSNNHIDIIHLLKEINFKGEIICPLSYGNFGYRVEIIKVGNEMFGKKFQPLIDFLPSEEYQSLIKSCGIVIMNHYRQQGMGNIISAIWYGAKVYLNKYNPAYNFFSKIGVNVLTIQENIKDLSNTRDLINEKEYITKNRKALSKYYSQEATLFRTKEFIGKIC